MKIFYLHDGNNQMGPFDIEDLKSKGISKESAIWYEGLHDWTTADKVEELDALFKLTPPPLGAKLAIPPIQNIQPKNTANNSKGGSFGRKLLTLAGIVVLILIGAYIYSQMQHQQYENIRQTQVNAEEDAKAMIRNNITSYVTAERSEYQYSQLGGIYNLKISVNNNTNYLIDNVKVRVIYIKANGDIWDSRIIDFNLLSPHTKNTVKVADTERGTSVKYEIVSIKSSVLGLN
jgi:hypothetical protein